MAIIAFIPVRGGSKSIPLKNIKSFCEKPLVYWNIKALSEVSQIDKIVIATDSEEIKDVVKSFGFDKVSIYNRSLESASDTASTESVMLEYLAYEKLDANDYFILVQATSPFTQASDFKNAINLIQTSKSDSLLSCTVQKRFFWHKNGESKNYNFRERPRRQDFEGELMENGAFYINKVGNILEDQNRLSGKIAIYEMPEYTSIEIDEPDDWIVAEALMKRHILNNKEKNKIKLFLCDVDGVLTDGGMYYSEDGNELKRFNTKDGMAFQLLRESDIKTGIITSENTIIVKNRAKKIKSDYLYQGKQHGGKLDVAKEICLKENISLNEVAYIGDDINCFELLSAVGWAACPSDAMKKIKKIKGINILSKRGGEGVVREFVEKILGIDEV